MANLKATDENATPFKIHESEKCLTWHSALTTIKMQDGLLNENFFTLLSRIVCLRFCIIPHMLVDLL